MSLATLRRVRAIERKVMPPARTWLFVVEDGDEPSPEQRAQVRPGDTVIIEGVPRGYLNGGEHDDR